MNMSMMASKARCVKSKRFIKERLDYRRLFKYFVDHGYMEIDIRERLLSFSHSQIIDEMYILIYHSTNDSDDVIDDILFKGLIATDQTEIVLKLFPDFCERARKIALDRVYENLKHLEENVDIPRLVKYIKDNKIHVPEYEGCPLKTHGMKTRRDDRRSITFWSFLVTRIENDHHFDCNTDALVQALRKTGQSCLVKVVFPEILMIVHCK